MFLLMFSKNLPEMTVTSPLELRSFRDISVIIADPFTNMILDPDSYMILDPDKNHMSFVECYNVTCVW